MKVSEVIELLLRLKEDFGDVEVQVGASKDGKNLIMNSLFEVLYNATQDSIELVGESKN